MHINYTYEITAEHTSQGIPLNPKENSEDRNSINLQDGIRIFFYISGRTRDCCVHCVIFKYKATISF